MNTLTKAVDDYLSVRRKLGYKLHQPGIFLKQFVSFLDAEGVAYITTELALRWATQPTNVKPDDTYWYLSSVPELLCLAAARLERSPGDFS